MQHTDQSELPFSDRVAVIGGSSRGIGLAVASSLASKGATVIVNGRDGDVAAAAAAAINTNGGRAIAVAGSPADPSVANAMIDAAVAQPGRFDIVINCAGAAEPAGSSILNITSEQWHDLIDSHLTTSFELCRAAVGNLVEAGGGSIVLTSSHAFTGIYGGTGYGAAKGAVNSLSASLAAELKEHKVRVNAVLPGATTRLSTGDDYTEQIEELYRRGLLDQVMYEGSKDPGSPEHAAALYTYLASDQAGDVTGQLFIAAGGYIGRFYAPHDEFLAWRDHNTNPPYTLDEVHTILTSD